MAKTKKKYDYRAIQAQKRNKQKIADAQAVARNKAFVQKYGKQIIAGAVAVVLLVIAIWLCCKWFVGPGGSIPNWFGTLRNVEENWVIANTGSTSSPKYFKFGEVAAPEGYTLTESYNYYDDDLLQNFTYVADDENATVQEVYFGGVSGATAEEMSSMVLSFYGEEGDEVQVAEVNGHEVRYLYVIFEDTSYDDEGNAIEVAEEEQTGTAYLYAYTNTVQDSSVLMYLATKDALLSELPTQEQLEAELPTFAALLTLAE